MVILFLVTIYFGYILGLLWSVALGLIYGVSLGVSYYFYGRRERAIRFLYVIQTVAVFVVLLVFVFLQAILGVHPFGYDILLLAFSALFTGGMVGIPIYRYAKIKPKPAAEPEK